MKTMIQHAKTGCYYTRKGWSPNREKALTFRTSLQALDYCQQHGLREVLLVLKFSDPRFDLRLNPFPQAQDHPQPRHPTSE